MARSPSAARARSRVVYSYLQGAGGIAPPSGFPASAVVALDASGAAASYNVIRNAAEAAPLPASVWGNPRPGLDPRINLGILNNLTFTAGQAGADGVAGAARLQWEAGAANPFALLGGLNRFGDEGLRMLPPGTYTMSLDAISLTGGDVPFKLGDAIENLADTSRTATPAWGTHSATFTVPAGGDRGFAFALKGGTTAGDIAVDNFRLVAGSAAGPVPGFNRHVTRAGRYPMAGQVIQARARAGNGIGGDAVGYVARTASGVEEAVTSFTVVAAVRMDDGLDPAAAYPVLAEMTTGGESSSDDILQLTQSAGQLMLTDRAGNRASTITAGMDKAGWVVIAARGGPAGMEVWMDGVRVATNTAAFAGGIFAGYQLLARGVGIPFVGRAAHLRTWERMLTDAEMVAATLAAGARVTALGEAYAPPPYAVIAEGDSLTDSLGALPAGNFVAQAARSLTRRAQVRTMARHGATLSYPGAPPSENSLWSRVPLVEQQIADALALGRTPVLSVIIGGNDTLDRINADPIAYAQATENYWTHMRSKGAKVIGGTFCGYDGLSADLHEKQEACRQSLRERAAAGKCDAFADYAIDAGMVPWSAPRYVDAVHQSPAGHAAMAPVLASKLAALMPGLG